MPRSTTICPGSKWAIRSTRVTASRSAGTTIKTIHHDSITTAAGQLPFGLQRNKFQFWFHDVIEGAASRLDADWRTVNDYSDSDKKQMLGHVNGVWYAWTLSQWMHNLDDFVGTECQIAVHAPDGEPHWVTPEDYDADKNLALVCDHGTWKFIELGGNCGEST